MPLRLRLATAADEDLLLDWANDPLVRAMARSTAQISRDQHHNWFQRKVADPSCRIWICENDSGPLGQIRLDRTENNAQIDVSVARAARGQGVGLFMLTADEITNWPGLRRLQASVRHANAASRALFHRADFLECGQDPDFMHLEKEIRRAPAR